MNVYHYSLVQGRTPRMERRNVGLLVVSSAVGKVWIEKGHAAARKAVLGDDLTFVNALLDELKEDAGQVARSGSAADVQDWFRSVASARDSTVRLEQVAVGVASDVAAEVKRLCKIYLGEPAKRARVTPAERIRDQTLRHLNIADRFHAKRFEAGPAEWGFAKVGSLRERGDLVLEALHFTQTTPDGLLESAFVSAGVAREVEHFHRDARIVAIASHAPAAPPSAFRRAKEVLTEAGVEVIDADTHDAAEALRRETRLVA